MITAMVTVIEQAAPNAGENGTLAICEGITPTEAELFAALEGMPDVGGTWTNIDLVYTYTVSATSPCTLEDATATVTVIQAVPNAGTDGTLTVCEGVTPTEDELFASLEGTPDANGDWTNTDLVYTYTVENACTTGDDASAIVTVTEQATADAGEDGTLTICEGTTPTDEELFAVLEGTPNEDGIWTNDELVYTYTVSATSPCTEDATATVTLTVNPLPVVDFTIDESNEPLIIFTNTSTEADSYSWDLGDGTTETSTQVSHTYDANGTYTVVLSATNSCGTVDNSQDVTIMHIGVLNISEENIQVYPNPVESVLNIELPVTNVNIQLINTNGKTLRTLETTENKNVEINVEGLASGVYYLIVTSENNERTVVKVAKK